MYTWWELTIRAVLGLGDGAGGGEGGGGGGEVIINELELRHGWMAR